MATVTTTFKFKRGLSTKWVEKNPILSAGEPGYELDTHKLKIGDGSTAWNDLDYVVNHDPITLEQIQNLFNKEEEE